MGIIVGICTSLEKGTKKERVQNCEVIEDFGIKDDAHAGKWHRQISLLSYEKIEEFKSKGVHVDDGAFGENLIVKDIDFKKVKVGTKFKIGEVELEVTQLGKKCHAHCRIYHEVGDCIMPREGVFTKALTGGKINENDEIVLIEGELD